jgi:hypothetical protein
MVYCQSVSNVTFDGSMTCTPQVYQCILMGAVILFALAIIAAFIYLLFFGIPRLYALENHYYKVERASYWETWRIGAKRVYAFYISIVFGLFLLWGFGCLVINLTN